MRREPNTMKCASWMVKQYRIDCEQLLLRYDLTEESFDCIQTSRSKLFIDLYMAYECILKSIIVYFFYLEDIERAHRKIKSFGHKINILVASLPDNVPSSLKSRHPKELSDFEELLKVDLRYGIESYWMHDIHEELFYETISCSDWRESLSQLIKDYLCWFDKALERPISGSFLSEQEPIESLMEVEYNPYRK